jgi:hypothetical protein
MLLTNLYALFNTENITAMPIERKILRDFQGGENLDYELLGQIPDRSVCIAAAGVRFLAGTQFVSSP